MNILEATSVTKTFDTAAGQVTVINKVPLNVTAGEFVAIMGQSGSGKSTLLYCVSGMDHVTSGEVIVDGRPLSGLSDSELADVRLRTMGFVFQNNYLLRNLTVKDNIMLPALQAAEKSPAEIAARADALMARMGVDHVADHAINQVSGGQLQRAADLSSAD